MSRSAVLTLLVLLTIGCAASPAPRPLLEECWVGEALTAAERTSVVIQFGEERERDVAYMSLPGVGVSGWPAVRVERNGDAVSLQFQSDSGLQVMDLVRTGDAMTGTWSEPRFAELANLSVRLDRGHTEPTEERITIAGPAGLIGASVILPRGEGTFPGVVFLHGSGRQPRDANRFAAQAMARRGFASIIFDKRGVGESQGEFAAASFDDLAADAVAVARYFSTRPEVGRVGFFGHSQGGWIGPLAGVAWDETAFVISSSGPAVAPSREAQWEVVRALRLANAGARAERQARRVIELWHDGVRSSDWTAFDEALEVARRQPWFEVSGLAAFAERPSPEFAASYRVSMDYDPMPTLRALRSPLLAILAPDDESIDAVETEQILTKLVEEGRDITIKTYAGFDHTLRRLGAGGSALRWPDQPQDYYDVQAAFIATRGQGRP